MAPELKHSYDFQFSDLTDNGSEAQIAIICELDNHMDSMVRCGRAARAVCHICDRGLFFLPSGSPRGLRQVCKQGLIPPLGIVLTDLTKLASEDFIGTRLWTRSLWILSCPRLEQLHRKGLSESLNIKLGQLRRII
ncbi:hypothetical protein PGT21_033468 [Puccinia graminis f. sp. tritici]|uniref:Uncharacterized protein n=1 Tax=Puccinia graminis f. sp. tritici TaxID=56615 RepID=A0A5B0QKD5_PUCGR|nr:hypothetical protein PGT21_033468 [Puccinia graminis f. sp. tritici]